MKTFLSGLVLSLAGLAGEANGQAVITSYGFPVTTFQTYDVYPYALPYDGIPGVTLSYGGFGAPYGGVAAYSYSSRYYGTPVVWPGMGIYPRYGFSRFAGFR